MLLTEYNICHHSCFSYLSLSLSLSLPLYQVTNVTGDVVWLTWTPNLEGGAPRGYTVRYKPENGSEYQVRQQCVCYID